MQREKFGSRLGFILISAGCAIGLGNVWRFPYITGKYGGAAFVLIYLVFLVLLGLPIMVMEFAVGRASQASVAMSFDRLEPLGTKWHWYKWFGMAGNYLLMMFYTTIGGWILLYVFKMAGGEFEGKNADEIAGVFGNLMENVNAHYERMEIVRPAYEKFNYLPLWALLRETVNLNSRDKAPSPAMAGATARAIFSGARYPASLLEAVMLRIRAERDITWGKAAIIKAYYLKNPHEDCPKEVLTVSLNEASTNPAYTLGRLFSVYEAVQQAANPGINATIKDKYFNSAAAMPASIFPVLNNLCQKHLRKLDARQRVHYDKQIMKLKGVLNENYPARMTLAQQGSFDLGYYHQTQKRYTKKEEKENV